MVRRTQQRWRGRRRGRIPEPTAGFEALAGHWAFYAQALDECWVDDERVLPNDGNFYGGWVTANVTGPIKGAPGTLLW